MFFRTKLPSVSARDAHGMISDGAQLVDVREKMEWDYGHAPSAKHIPLNTIPANLHKIDKTKPVIVVCRGGSRSASAAAFLSEQGFNVHNLEGGMVSWARHGLDVVAGNGRPGTVA
ncbi:MAG: rhodanese-like domain-containing protein [Actinomycetota bacterium]|nr:rhodanese-like domain-containing protein [Actinomycetota bacterium]